MGQNPGSTIICRGADDPAGTSKRKRIILTVEAIVALIVVVLVARALWSNTGLPGQESFTIPQRISGFALQKSETGPRAVENFNKLHGKDVGASTGWVGYYEGNAIIWTAEAGTDAKAFQLVDAMTRRIRVGNDMFGNLESLRIGDMSIFTVIGQGQRHYYYQKGSRVIWIAAPRPAERAFLDDALKQIN